VPECDGESSKMRRPWPTGGLLNHGKKIIADYDTHLPQSVRDKTVIKHDRLAVTDNYSSHALYLLGTEIVKGQSHWVKTRYV
jgi:hypothetical protein